MDDKETTKRFKPPTVEGVAAYVKEEGYIDVNPEKWWNFYDAKGWKIGKTKMVRWKSAVATWTKTTKSQRFLHQNKICHCGCGRKTRIIIDGNVYFDESCFERMKRKRGDISLTTLPKTLPDIIYKKKNKYAAMDKDELVEQYTKYPFLRSIIQKARPDLMFRKKG